MTSRAEAQCRIHSRTWNEGNIFLLIIYSQPCTNSQKRINCIHKFEETLNVLAQRTSLSELLPNLFGRIYSSSDPLILKQYLMNPVNSFCFSPERRAGRASNLLPYLLPAALVLVLCFGLFMNKANGEEIFKNNQTNRKRSIYLESWDVQ